MKERVSVETLVKRSLNRLGAVHSMLPSYTEELIRRAYPEGINVQISSGFRSDIDQAYIYGQGRPNYVYKGVKYGRPGKIVSKAKPGTSVHNYGLAIDYFLTSEDGSVGLWNVDSKWLRVGAIAKAMGFEWGGDWTSFKDYPHLQFNKGLSISQLKNGARPTFPALKVIAAAQTKKEEVEYMKPSNATLRVGVENALKKMKANGTLSSNSHLENFKAGTMTVSDAIALGILSADRQFNDIANRLNELEKK